MELPKLRRPPLRHPRVPTVVEDLGAELLKFSGKTVSVLTALLDDPDAAIRLRAASTIADRLWGSPVSRSEIMATVNSTETCHVVTPAELAAAAKAFLLRHNAQQAETVEVEQ